MIIKCLGLIIGLCVLAAGIYYLVKEKNDKDSRKIYGIISLAGLIVAVVSAVMIVVSVV